MGTASVPGLAPPRPHRVRDRYLTWPEWIPLPALLEAQQRADGHYRKTQGQARQPPAGVVTWPAGHTPGESGSARQGWWCTKRQRSAPFVGQVVLVAGTGIGSGFTSPQGLLPSGDDGGFWNAIVDPCDGGGGAT